MVGRWPRIRLATLLVVVALLALPIAWTARRSHERIRSLRRLRASHAERVRWAQRMKSLGYMNAKQVAWEQKGLEEIDRRIAELGAWSPR